MILITGKSNAWTRYIPSGFWGASLLAHPWKTGKIRELRAVVRQHRVDCIGTATMAPAGSLQRSGGWPGHAIRQGKLVVDQ